MNVVTAVGNGENILAIIQKQKPNMVLLDLGLRSQNSLRIVKLVKKEFPEVKIIVMDLIPLQTDIFEFVQAGVYGFTLKDIGVPEFLKTILIVFAGTQVLPPHLTESLFSQIVDHALKVFSSNEIDDSVRLTKRE